MRSRGGGGHADVLGTDGAADVLTVQVDVLCAVQQADIQPDLRQQCGHGVGVVGVHTRAHGVQPDGAVHSACVDVDIAQILGQCLGQAGFTGPGRAIDCNGNHVYHPLLNNKYHFGFSLGGEAAARKRLMRGEFADTTHKRVAAV